MSERQGDERLSLSFGGELSRRIRSAADAAGQRPSEWVARVVSRALPAAEESSPTARATPPDAPAGELEWQEQVDPTGGFLAETPRGWRSELRFVQQPGGPRGSVVTVSPDGSTTLVNDDVEIGAFQAPGPMAGFLGLPVRPPAPADRFGAEWLQYRFGARPGFRLLDVRPLPELVARFQQAAAEAGMAVEWCGGVLARAEFRDGEGTVTVAAAVRTGGAQGIWTGGVGHVVSHGDAAAFVPALLRLMASVRPTPATAQRQQAEKAARDAQHRATMNQIQANTRDMTMRHQQNMAWIQQQGTMHQQRMADMQATFDSQNDSWRRQQAGLDAGHAATMSGIRSESSPFPAGGGDPQRDFINAMREERTVVDADGWEHQVEAGSDKYYRRDHDESWIGLQQHEDIRDVPGIDPDDYYETPIIS